MCKKGHLLASDYLHREQVRMLMKAAVGQDSSSPPLISPPFSPPPSSLPSLSSSQMGVLKSHPLLQGHKEPMWSQLLQLLSSTLQISLPISPTCSQFLKQHPLSLVFSEFLLQLPFWFSMVVVRLLFLHYKDFIAPSLLFTASSSCRTGLLKTQLLTQARPVVWGWGG